MHILGDYHIDYGMEHVVYLTVKKGNKGNREPVAVEHMQLGQMRLSRVTLLEAYLEAWEQPSHVCGVIWDKIKECCIEESRRSDNDSAGDLRQEPDTGQEPTERESRYVAGLDVTQPNTDWRKIAGKASDMHRRVSLRELHRYFPDYQVWDRSFQGYLQRHRMAGEWLRVWRVPVYDQYGGPEQLQTLLDNVEGWQQLSQILVLGFDPSMPAWLPKLARRARGIDFYLDYEPRDMEKVQEWIDEEYGLVTQWRILESREQTDVGQEAEQQENGETEEAAVKKSPSYPGLSQYLRSYGVPCLVLDFTGVADVPVTGLRQGSMWWDMGAMEEKRHLLEDRPLGVRYVSLRTLWRDLV